MIGISAAVAPLLCPVAQRAVNGVSMKTNQNIFWPLAAAVVAAIVIGCGGGGGTGLSTSGGTSSGLTGGSGFGPNARGVASSVDSIAGKFVLSVASGTGVSAGSTLTIITTPSTQFFAASGQQIGKDQFFSLLPGARNVQIEGTISLDQGQCTASKLKLEDQSGSTTGGTSGSTSAGGGSGDAEATGAASNVGASGFTITLASWEGFSAAAGSTVTVQTTSTTEFKLNGQTVSASAFFAALGSASSVKVEGTFANGVFTATEAKIGSGSGTTTGGSDGSDDNGGSSAGSSSSGGGSDDTGGSSGSSTSSGGSDDTGGHGSSSSGGSDDTGGHG